MLGSQLINKMSEDLLFSKDKLYYLIRSAPHRYKTYYIKKRSGEGLRLIAQPAKEVKMLQYWVMQNIFPSLPIHEAATAYVKNKSIKNNVEPHTTNPFLLKLDLKDFFPSIKEHDFIFFMSKQPNIRLSYIDIGLLAKILFWRFKNHKVLQLSIGAPSSPFLSNAIMYQFDTNISEYCKSNNIAYTRYADDMTFSMQNNHKRKRIIITIRDMLSQMPHPRLLLNEEKTIFSSKANKRLITGLIVSNDGNVTIGRNKKRLLRAQVHRYLNGTMSNGDVAKLKGTISYIKSIEPDFIEKLFHKYNINSIEDV